ncbi:hypothetical protein ACLB2K_065360 [Fragaria x ananassa]
MRKSPNLVHVKMRNMQKPRCLGSEFYGYDRISSATSDGRNAVFPALRSLHIEEAENLIDRVETRGTLRAFPCLEKLTLLKCKQLRSTPSRFPSLKKLEIREVDSGLVSIPFIPEHGGLPSLSNFCISDCDQLSSLPEGLQYCTSLKHFEIWSFPKITSIPIPSEGLPSLFRLGVSIPP